MFNLEKSYRNKIITIIIIIIIASKININSNEGVYNQLLGDSWQHRLGILSVMLKQGFVCFLAA